MMSAPLLAAAGVTVAYGGLVAVNAANVAVRPGTIHGLIGPNGAGKSTFLNAISGLAPVRSGRLDFRGTDITAFAPHRRAALGIARTFQHLQLMEDRTALENILVGNHLHIGAKEGLARVWVGSDQQAMQNVRKTMELLEFDVDAVALAPVNTLTLYQRRRVEIARALVAQPSLLMLDEPAAGLSPASIVELMTLIRKIRSELRIAIVLIEHVISMVVELCDVVTVFDKGSVISEGTPQYVVDDPLVRNAYLGQMADA